MTVEEKREKLHEYCMGRGCGFCKLHSMKTCRCGHGFQFMHKPESPHYMSDAEIIGAYQIVFGNDAEALSAEVIESVVDCAGLHIIAGDDCTINIYNKEG